MIIRRFIPAVLALAVLIVIAGGLINRNLSPPFAVIDVADLAPAGHSFVRTERPDSIIECRLTSLPDWESMWDHDPSPCALVDGWHLPNDSGTLVQGKTARAEIHLADNYPRIFLMRVKAHPHLPENIQQSVRLLVNDVDLGTHPVERDWHRIRQRIPRKALRAGRNEVVLEFSQAVSQRQVDLGKESLAVAANIDHLSFSKPRHPTTDTTSTTVWNEERQAFIIRESGALVMPVRLPEGATVLALELQASHKLDPSATIELAIEDLDGQRRQTEVGWPSIRDQDTIVVEIEGLAGRWALLTLDVALRTGDLAVSNPQIKTAFAGGSSPSTSALDNDGSASMPDIVLITLDAARADRFSFAGHDRETSPFIDAIAAEATVFPHAYALAPYTLCSVPTMITGLSFLDHGVVSHHDVLSDGAITLAESLGEAGYQTVAFSGTPNNSRSKGFHQGYEVFRELWTEGDRSETRRAHFVAQRVIDWIEANDDERPLHLQIHMVPPHAPYDPPAEFDIFTDDGYDGPCDGFHKTISAISGREIVPTAECIDHLLNLYDGNLRAADDATGLIIQALKNRPRWKDTVVLITSDHGEAFMDHGDIGHNSTVYGEMLHVPFVLRLPPNRSTHSIVSDRLVTLADITPTLLGMAGITSTQNESGVDLLSPDAPTAGRFMVARTTSSRSYFGLRTLRWSQRINGAGAGALFDLSSDPGEMDDLAYRRSAVFTGLGRILTRRIVQPPRLAVATATADITDDEKDLLEALGYIRD